MASVIRKMISVSLLFLCFGNLARADLNQSLKLKEAHLQFMAAYYEKLFEAAQAKDFQGFCESAKTIAPTLGQNLKDDQVLIQALYQVHDEDYFEYGKTIEENSLSDYFANFSHLDRCEKENFEPRADFLQALQYNVVNVQYLGMNHELWMSAHPSLNLK
jgi:hypothetical protein